MFFFLSSLLCFFFCNTKASSCVIQIQIIRSNVKSNKDVLESIMSHKISTVKRNVYVTHFSVNVYIAYYTWLCLCKIQEALALPAAAVCLSVSHKTTRLKNVGSESNPVNKNKIKKGFLKQFKVSC